jgi:hypothetical protein
MANGPGKYDDLCTLVREQAQAGVVVLIVVHGNKGSGFSVQATDPGFAAELPSMLRMMANEIEGTPQ